MLINSANLMGDTSEPGNFRGFGRIHLEAGMPLSGEGKMALFVADAGDTAIDSSTYTQYLFDVDAEAGLDMRATLSWIDPAATTMSAMQLVNDLDLRVISPNGTKYTMWSSTPKDKANVNERVIVDGEDVVESGTWAVRVRSRIFSTDTQSYSLVVTGAISPGTGDAPKTASSPQQNESVEQAQEDDDAEVDKDVDEAENSGLASSATLVLLTTLPFVFASALTAVNVG